MARKYTVTVLKIPTSKLRYASRTASNVIGLGTEILRLYKKKQKRFQQTNKNVQLSFHLLFKLL